jgi:hypothetical protein
MERRTTTHYVGASFRIGRGGFMLVRLSLAGGCQIPGAGSSLVGWQRYGIYMQRLDIWLD